MGLVIKLNNIISPNAFTVSYKTGPNPYPLDSGFTSFGGTYSAGTTLVVVSGVTINFNSSYWFKITDNVTNRYIIENVETNDPIAYMSCCPTPSDITAVCVIPTTPTPTPTPTPVCEVPTEITAYCSDSTTPTPTPTSTPTPTPTSTSTPTPTATPTGVSLQINARDVASLPDTLTMFYSVNGGTNINIPGGTGVVFPISCTNIYTITGLSVNDEVIFGTSISCIMTGAQGLTCPSSIGSSTTYTYTVDVSSVQSVGITIDSDIIP